jgi:transcriptional regulator EpsA
VGGANGSALHEPQLEALLARYGLANLACHGLQNVDGGAETCFVFARMPEPLGARQRYLLEILLPYLNAAYVRTLVGGRREQRASAPDQRLLTGREVEILRWVSEGKSNHQIGSTLRISPLTVKNHVQNILRKLAVQNRTQAVSKAINLRLIDSSRQT